MKILEYLKSFGEEVLQLGSTLYALAAGFTRIFTDFEAAVNDRINQIYLMTASSTYLDRWGWNMVRLRRKPLEDDERFRWRIIREMFTAYSTRKGICKVIKGLTGQYPVEIFEPVRDSAYLDAGFYMVEERRQDSCAAGDGTGTYCARIAEDQWLPYRSYVKVQNPGFFVGGGNLSFTEALQYIDNETWISDETESRRVLTLEEVCDALADAKVWGTRVFLEYF